MSEVPDQFIKRGIWTNTSKGAAMGRTLTVDASTGNFIVALLSIVATAAIGQLWNLLAFLYHQSRAHGVSSDGLFWQQQALLRTLPTPTAMLVDSMKLWWAWRNKADRPLLRSSVSLLSAFVFSIAAIVAGIFTSYVVDTTNLEVLVSNNACAFVSQDHTYRDLGPYSASVSSLNPVVQSYARNCYTNSSFLPLSCRNVFTRPNVSFTADPAACPWESSMCLEGDMPALSMDSGLLDMAQFGLNVHQNEGVKYRKKTTCNVLQLDGHTVVDKLSYWKDRYALSRVIQPEEEGIAFRYGAIRTTVQPEDTFVRSLVAGNVTKGFTLKALRSRLGIVPEWNEWNPIPEMNHSSSDNAGAIGVFMGQVAYNAPIDDPLFSAHKSSNGNIKEGGYTYYPDDPGRVVGCKVQYQFCITQISAEDICSDLSGLPAFFSQEDFPAATETQLAILRLLWVASQLYDVTSAPNQNVLQMTEKLSNLLLATATDNQWAKEVIGWESYAWAGIQNTLVDFIVGPKIRDLTAAIYLAPPTSTGEQRLCKMMKVRKPGGFANINFFGLAFIITFCFVITVFNMTVLRLFIFLSKFRHTLAPGIDRWVQDGIFQLTRRAYEAYGEGTWIDLEKGIPSTSEKELLPELPVHSLPIHMTQAPTIVPFSAKTSMDKNISTKASQGYQLDFA